MDGSNLNNSDIYFGKVDDEEDEDAYLPYGITNIKLKSIAEPKVSELTGFNTGSFADNVLLNKTKKTKKKNVVNPSKSIQNNDSKIQQAELPSNQSQTSEVSSSVKQESNEIRNNISESLFNVSASQNRNVAEQFASNNQASVPLQTFQRQSHNFAPYNPILLRTTMYNNMTAQPLLNMLLNNQSMINNQPRPTAPTNIDNASNMNYSLTSTYNYRLRVIDTLFRFIMQILQTPEPPQVHQIESLKQMLDSLVVTKPTELYGKKN